METAKNLMCKKQNSILRLLGRTWEERGSSIIELALGVPVLVGLALGASEFARVEYASIEVSNAALAGVQYGGQNVTAAADTTGIQTAAQTDAPNITLGTTTATTACTCSDGSSSTCSRGDCPGADIETILTVETQATIDPMIHLPGFPTTYTVHGQAIQKVLE
jgi:Flp pilus assembly protein TadG